MARALSQVTQALEELAPLSLAEPWDNVGLLLEPWAHAAAERRIERLLLTIDLTDEVLAEAILRKCGLVVSYHPPIFSGLKRLVGTDSTARRLLQAASAGLCIYSPHTALDAAPGGVNDWLIEAAGEGERQALRTLELGAPRYKLVVYVPEGETERLREALCSTPGLASIGEYSACTFHSLGEGTFLGSEASNPKLGERGKLERVREARLEMLCDAARIGEVEQIVRRHHPYEEPAWELYRLEPQRDKRVGPGRSVKLTAPRKLDELVSAFKAHLGLGALRVAASARHQAGEPVVSVAVCAGAGGSVFQGASPVDLYVTGELRHHDILAMVARGASVFVTDHSNSERGYLPRYRQRILEKLGDLEVELATADADPLRIV